MDRRAFLDAVPRLFAAVHSGEQQAYDDAIYREDLPPTLESIEYAFRFVGVRAPSDALLRLGPVLEEIRFPRVDPLPPLAQAYGIEPLTATLHFYHPSYPMLRSDAWKGAFLLGLVRTEAFPDPTRFKEAYLDYLYAVEVVKEELRHFQVPESNCFLARVVEAALTGVGRGLRVASPSGHP